MREQSPRQSYRRLGPPRWVAYWVAPVRADLGEGGTPVRAQPVLASHRPDRVGHPDHQSGTRGTRRDPGYRVQYATRWFVTYQEYEAWRDTLPVQAQIDSDLLAHIGHTPLEFKPQDCTACALNEHMAETVYREAQGHVCPHGVRLDVEDCDIGC